MSVGTKIGDRVMDLRTERGLTQEELADRAGTSPTTISNLEGGKIKNPHYRTLRGVATALGVGVEELTGPPPQADTRPPAERVEARLAPRIEFLERLDLSELSEHRRELEERLGTLKRPLTREEFFAGVDPFTDYVSYLETTDELLATIRLLERIAGRVTS